MDSIEREALLDLFRDKEKWASAVYISEKVVEIRNIWSERIKDILAESLKERSIRVYHDTNNAPLSFGFVPERYKNSQLELWWLNDKMYLWANSKLKDQARRLFTKYKASSAFKPLSQGERIAEYNFDQLKEFESLSMEGINDALKLYDFYHSNLQMALDEVTTVVKEADENWFNKLSENCKNFL